MRASYTNDEKFWVDIMKYFECAIVGSQGRMKQYWEGNNNIFRDARSLPLKGKSIN